MEVGGYHSSMAVTARVERLRPHWHVVLERDRRVLSNQQVLTGLQRDPDLRQALTEAIAEAPLKALFWECQPISGQTLDDPWRAVLVESRALAHVDADPGPFARHLGRLQAPAVTVFPNLGRDALLVVPASPADSPTPDSHAHLAIFCRRASADQVDRFWVAVGAAATQRLEGDPSPLWISTSGLGVHWLHARLDSRPKYYTYSGFRVPP